MLPSMPTKTLPASRLPASLNGGRRPDDGGLLCKPTSDCSPSDTATALQQASCSSRPRPTCLPHPEEAAKAANSPLAMPAHLLQIPSGQLRACLPVSSCRLPFLLVFTCSCTNSCCSQLLSGLSTVKLKHVPPPAMPLVPSFSGTTSLRWC